MPFRFWTKIKNAKPMNYLEEIRKELDRAAAARKIGNEGQARVCARRAAGFAIREYFERHGLPITTTSAYELLRALAELPDLAPDLRQAAHHLTLRVTNEFRLPMEVDLIIEARKICKGLEEDQFFER